MSQRSALAYGAWRALGLNAVLRRIRPGALVLCYHNVVEKVPSAADRSLHLPVADFEAQMDCLQSTLEVVPLAELLARHRSGTTLRGLAAVTFDDAYTGVIRHALPLLDRRRLPATIFATGVGSREGRPFWWDHPGLAERLADAGRRDALLRTTRGDRDAVFREFGLSEPEVPSDLRPATWRELATVQRGGVDVQAHSSSHRSLPMLADRELAAEMRHAFEEVHSAMPMAPTSIAYPYGHADARVAAAAAAAGFQSGFTLRALDITRANDPHLLPRLNVPAGIGLAAFEAWTSGLKSRSWG